MWTNTSELKAESTSGYSAGSPMGIRQWLSEKAGIARAIGVALVCTIGARIVLPGINREFFADFCRSAGASPLLRVYDWFVGGAMARGALLALGILPYVTARIY